jgi:hypothetical protein
MIDGVIDEEVWLGSYKFEMAWDDDVIKYSYRVLVLDERPFST